MNPASGRAADDTPSGSGDLTTLQVRRALTGDRASLDWVVARLSPALRAHAAYRIGPLLRPHLDPDDLVAEAWLVAFERLGEFIPSAGRCTPRLLSFLARTVTFKVNDHLKKCVRRGELLGRSPLAPTPESQLGDRAADVSGVVTNAVRRERKSAVEEGLEHLEAPDRQVILLRAIEGLSNDEVARELGESASTVSHRYRRALEKLRKALPASVFEDIED